MPRRAAQIYAEVVGYGLSGGAYHVTARRRIPSSGAFHAALDTRAAMRESQASTPASITSMRTAPRRRWAMNQARGVRRLFGDAIGGLSMSSTKSAIVFAGQCRL